MRDAVYRGTMVCDQLLFSLGKSRGAIEVTISGSAVHCSLSCDYETQPRRRQSRDGNADWRQHKPAGVMEGRQPPV